MTLREIDDLIAAWNSRLNTAEHNLLELHSEPTFQVLTGTGGCSKVPLTNATASQLEPALNAVTAAFQELAALRRVIDQAEQLRRNMPTFLGSQQRLLEIEQLLRGKSIPLPPPDLPLAQRTLLSGQQPLSCTPDELLNTVAHAYSAAKDLVVAVRTAWDNAAVELDRNQKRIESLSARPNISAAVIADLQTAEQALQTIRSKVQPDPFGAQQDLARQVIPVLDRLERTADAADRLQKQVSNALAGARATLDALAEVHREAVAACNEARLKVSASAPCPPPIADEKLQAVRDWLRRLDANHSGAALDQIEIGLRKWNLAAQDCVTKDKIALAANRARLEARSELRGRLDALKAKARAYRVGEDRDLSETAKRAETLLYSRPTSIDEAVSAVAQYGQLLNAKTKATINQELKAE